MRVLLAFLFGLLLVGAGIAEEPSGDRIFPARAELHVISRATDGGFILVESTTMGRLNDTGYLWEVHMPALADAGPTLIRKIIDCPTRAFTDDWMTFLDPNMAVEAHQPGLMTYDAGTPETDREAALACGTEPAPTGLPLLGLAGAAHWARQQPPLVTIAELSPHMTMTEKGFGGDFTVDLVRRGDSRIYDGTWATKAGETFTDTLELHDVINGELTFYRAGLAGYYRFPMSGRIPGYGKASWPTDPGYEVFLQLELKPIETASPELPPPYDVDLVQLMTFDDGTVTTVFFEQNWVGMDIGAAQATAWIYLGFAQPVSGAAGTFLGYWTLNRFECADPKRTEALSVVMVRDDRTLVEPQPIGGNVRPVQPNAIDLAMWQSACLGLPIPDSVSKGHYAALSKAIAAAAVAVVD